MGAREIVSEFLEKGIRLQRPERSFFNLVVDAIVSVIPRESIEEGFEGYVKWYGSREEPGVEVGMLTRDNIAVDVTYDLERRSVTRLPLGPEASVVLNAFFPAPEVRGEWPVVVQEMHGTPYRAELRLISSSGAALTYVAEGDRRQVRALVLYGEKCLKAGFRKPEK